MTHLSNTKFTQSEIFPLTGACLCMRVGRVQGKCCVNRLIDGNKYTLQTDTSVIILAHLFRLPRTCNSRFVCPNTDTQRVLFSLYQFCIPLQWPSHIPNFYFYTSGGGKNKRNKNFVFIRNYFIWHFAAFLNNTVSHEGTNVLSASWMLGQNTGTYLSRYTTRNIRKKFKDIQVKFTI